MVIIKLMGGLGNQMFQYALGRHFALKHQTQLKLDISYFSTQKKRNYELSVFNIEGAFASPEEIKTFSGRNPNHKETLFSLLFNHPKTYVRKREIKFYPHILSLPDNVYLDGYWQSEKYFKDIADIVRQEFTVKTPPSEKNRELEQRIAAAESVSIHFRRGDYVTEPTTHDYHGICGLEYYTQCIKLLAKKVSNLYLFVFSDDMEWVRCNFKSSFPITYIDHNAGKAFEDLRLMTQCKHHIIANSSFSWWGAWLNPRHDKIVLAPQKWFKNPFCNRDIIPSHWIRL